MPKQFRFPLQKVLDVREIKEDLKVIELKKAQMALQTEQMKLDGLETQKSKVLNDHSIDKNEGSLLNSSILQQSMDYLTQINNAIGEQKEKIQSSEKLVEKNHLELAEAVKEKKIVEKLREKQQTEHAKKNRKIMISKESEVAIRISQKNLLMMGIIK